MSLTRSWTVEPPDDGLRLDVAVASHLEDVSRAQVRKWIDEGRVLVGGNEARASRLCREGESIEIEIPEPRPAEPEAESIPLAILYEDEHVIVVDKPAGMVVHPSPGHSSGTLVNALLAHCNDLSGIGGVERPGIVHRLDVGTTGVIVVAKNDRAHRHLSEQFQHRQVDKRYVGLVHGSIPEELSIDRAIGRDPVHRTKISSKSQRAKPAVSDVRRLEALVGSSLVEIRIRTGRTHQIRVHLSEVGYPMVGDRDYGAPRRPPTGMSQADFRPLREFPRPALHAASLELTHPHTGERIRWEAPLPDDMERLLMELRALRESGSSKAQR